MTYEIVNVQPDTPEWETERQKSIGASEVAAVLGLSQWDTPLSIYRSKLGVAREFDPVLGFIGHASEPIIAEWVERFSEQRGVKLEPALMARSVEWPWLHASFDRVSHDPSGHLVTWQFKTAHQYTGHHWDDGVPDDIRVQVNAEMAVAGTTGAWVVVWIGGREFRLFWEPRDDAFIEGYLVPQTREFWDAVKNRREPQPSTLHELYEVYPSAADTVLEGSEQVVEAAERRAVLLSDIRAQQAEADALTLTIGQYMGNAETLLAPGGRKVLTYKTQQGRRSVRVEDAEREAPHLIRQGSPFKVMRHVKERTK